MQMRRDLSMLNVFNHWDPLQSCIVGKSYSPKFYDFVSDTNVRSKLCTIAEQTEEDLDNLSKQLQKFGVHVMRPSITDNYLDVLYGNKLLPAPLTPRDYTAVIDDKVFIPTPNALGLWNRLRGADWPLVPPQDITEYDGYSIENLYDHDHTWLAEVAEFATEQGNEVIYDADIDTAMVHRVGNTLYVGNWVRGDPGVTEKLRTMFPDKTVKLIETAGHLDGRMCMISGSLLITTPGLDVEDMFPDHEIYTVNSTVNRTFSDEKQRQLGKWWVPDQLTSPDFEDYISNYLSHWLGEIRESCFDVNLLIVNKNTVFCSSEDPGLFKSLESHGITPHIVPFRHKLFWDGGLHCVTADLDRQ